MKASEMGFGVMHELARAWGRRSFPVLDFKAAQREINAVAAG